MTCPETPENCSEVSLRKAHQAGREFFAPESVFRTPRQVLLEPPQTPLSGPADWQAIYGRPGPVTLEIGCGGGRTIIGMALAHPERNFLGVEIAGEYFRMIRDRALKRGISNLRVTRTDAAYLIQEYFPAACVEECHIYFPDPWPKKRHHKRRIFSESFCAQLARTLTPSGTLYAATDHHEYYLELLPRLRAALDVQEHPGVWEDAPLGRTNYEVKYIREGRPIYRLTGRRKT